VRRAAHCSKMDIYNPLYEKYNKGEVKDIEAELNKQNQVYGAHVWYPLLEGLTPASILYPLTENDIEKFSLGIMPENDKLTEFVNLMIKQDYKFVKTTHKSAHAFKPLLNLADFEEQMLNASVIMSFRRYRCAFLLFRKWTEMNLECRVYVYEKKIKYIEVYRDVKKEFEPEMFETIQQFVQENVIARLSEAYTPLSFTADLFLDQKEWKVIEINRPLWLKAGTHLIKYDWEKNRIHSCDLPICCFKDKESNEVIEL
jgi:hypothetical protein